MDNDSRKPVLRSPMVDVPGKLMETGRAAVEFFDYELKRIRESLHKRIIRVSEAGEGYLSIEQRARLLKILKARFEKQPALHPHIEWRDVEYALKVNPEKFWPLWRMEMTGGNPNVFSDEGGDFVFGDCSIESPYGRRYVVFDAEAQKDFEDFSFSYCGGNAVDKAAEFGADLMDEIQYRALQEKLHIDRRTSSWLKTPSDIRNVGFALGGFCKKGGVHVYNDGVDYCSGRRGFRCVLKVAKT